MLRVSQTSHTTNIVVLQKIGLKESTMINMTLIFLINKLQFYFRATAHSDCQCFFHEWRTGMNIMQYQRNMTHKIT